MDLELLETVRNMYLRIKIKKNTRFLYANASLGLRLQHQKQKEEKMKRKGVEQVGDDSADLYLSAPATKSRRLDAGLLASRMEDETSLSEAEIHPERSIVVFKPFVIDNNDNSPSLYVHPHPNFFSTLSNLTRDQFLCSTPPAPHFMSPHHHQQQLEEEREEPAAAATDHQDCLAVVPWVSGAPQAMEIEEQDQAKSAPAWHQWYQYHCMPHHLPLNAPTPITWFR